MTLQRPVVTCFAVRAEAVPFQRTRPPQVEVLITGMGPARAAHALRARLSRGLPDRVLTCGFAGGLDPALRRGQVVFDADERLGLDEALGLAGAVRVTFHCSNRVASTAVEKRRLREQTGAHAVEMESGVIRDLCRQREIPAATIRVISDVAGEDLPVDFNKLFTPTMRLHFGRLAGRIIRSPRVLVGLLRLHRTTREAADRLAETLTRALAGKGVQPG